MGPRRRNILVRAKGFLFFDSLSGLIKRIRGNQVARNTVWMFLGQGLRIVIQSVYFVLIARSLGAGGYGAFIGTCALVAIFAPFASLGSGNLLIKNIARQPGSFNLNWGRALLMVLLSGSMLFIIVLGAAHFVLPPKISLLLVLLISVSDLFFARVHELNTQAFQGFERLEKTARITLLPSMLRLFSIAGLSFFIRAPTPVEWGFLYLLTIMISSAIGVRLVSRAFGGPIFRLARLKTELKEGLYFSIGNSAATVYNDMDKTMLARLSTLAATGIYGAAYRLIDVSFTPVMSLLNAAYPGFFLHGAKGIKGSFSFAKKMFPAAAGYGIAEGILIIAAAPLLPVILGAQYNDTAVALRWLAPLPFIKSVHYFAADILTGAGFQGARSAVQALAAFFNVLINLWLIPAYSWRGAAWSSLASDSLLAISLWSLVHINLTGRKTGKAAEPLTDIS